MRTVYVAGIVALTVGSLVPGAVAQPPNQSTEIQQLTIETAYRGRTPALRIIERDFDWNEYRARGMEQMEHQAVPNKIDFVFRNQRSRRRTMDVLRQRRARHSLGKIDIKSSFEGTSDADNLAVLGFRVVPPDTNGDVGRRYYAQMNNLVFEIFEKDRGPVALQHRSRSCFPPPEA